MSYLKSTNLRVVSSVLVLIVLSLARGSETSHIVEKRQVGVLARTGALPQGKRSVEALARNGELPVLSDDKRDNSEDHLLEQLIRELGTAEGLSRLRIQALADKLESERDDDYEEIGKRSVSSLARNSQLPQKRVVSHRSGYLIRPSSPEPADEETDLLDPDDFLGKTGVGVLALNGGFNVADGSFASFAKHGYEDNGEEVAYVDDDSDYEDGRYPGEKRHVGAARNFFSDGRSTVGSTKGFLSFEGREKKNLASFKNPGKRTLGSAMNFGKRNVGAARNFLLSEKRNIGSLKSSGKRNVGAAKNFLLGEGKRNLGAAKNFFVENNRNLAAAKDFLYGKRNMASFSRDGGLTNLKYPMNDYDWDDFFDFDDFHEEQEKRNLGASKNFGKRSADVDNTRGTFEKDKKEQMTPKVQEKESNKTRTKRDAFLESQTDEYPMPVLQTSGELDYGDVEALADGLDVQKRFLGSENSRPKYQQYLGVTKRHIGALARLGWLPSFRATRYSRSGRAISSRSMAPFRPHSAIGSCTSEDANTNWSAPPSITAKMVLGPKGIFRRVGRSLFNGNTILLEPQRNDS